MEKTFLVEIDVESAEGDYTLTRLVIAKDKNEAWQKTDEYMRQVYFSCSSDAKYKIHVTDTII